MTSHGLSQTQAQKQIISTQMQLGLQILQATALELEQLVQQEMAMNPVLELDEELEEKDDVDPEAEPDEEFEDSTPTEQEWDDYWADAPASGARVEGDEDRYDHEMESITGVTSLAEYLREQLMLWPDHDAATQAHVEALIGQLDERGFLGRPVAEIAEELGVPVKQLQAAQDVLTSFEPPGIGATDLRHSLLLQLERQKKQRTLAYIVLRDHFNDLASRRLPHIARALDVEVEDISQAAHVIATLDPSPGGKFQSTRDRYVTTDVVVERDGDEWKAELTAQDVPKLRISRAYKDMLAESANGDARSYLRDKIKAGKQLISTIEQRQQTLLRITQEIIKRQPEFFDKGRAHLRPMTMTPIAQELGVHETTISRAVAGKYIRTPRGLMEMRAFFTTGLATASGDELSNTSVKEALAELIKGEDTRAPLSDDKLAQMLNDKGIQVARRTVAKYREELGILPMNLRRTY